MNLLYIAAGEKSYYVLVKHLTELVLRQYDNDSSKRHFCQYCLNSCTSEVVLKKQMEKCKLNGAQIIQLPEAGDKKWHDKVEFTKNRIPTMFTFCHLLGFRKRIM